MAFHQPLIIRALARLTGGSTLNQFTVVPKFLDKVHEEGAGLQWSDPLIIDFTAVCASRMGISLQKAEIDILVEYLHESAALVGSYILQLEKRSRSIPLRLWSGSSGIIWIRMLQDAVLSVAAMLPVGDHAEVQFR